LYTLEKEYFSDRSLTYTIKSKDSTALVFSYSSVSTSDFEIHDQEAVIVFDNFISENANAILESSHLDNTTETKNSYLMSLI
jgi:hypothetical protein